MNLVTEHNTTLAFIVSRMKVMRGIIALDVEASHRYNFLHSAHIRSLNVEIGAISGTLTRDLNKPQNFSLDDAATQIELERLDKVLESRIETLEKMFLSVL